MTPTPENYDAWAAEHDAVIVFRYEDDEPSMRVYAYLNGRGECGDEDPGVVVLHQGGASIHVPYADLGHFVDRLEALYTDEQIGATG